MTDPSVTDVVDIAAVLAAAGVTVTAVPRDRMMQVTVRTPPGWTGDKGVLASRVLQSLRPTWQEHMIGADVAVIAADD